MNPFSFLSDLLSNQILWIPAAASLIAQGLKLIIEFIRHGKANPEVLFTTGGMPSSHSALVAALATEVGRHEGVHSSEFAIAAMFAVIVMYDAAGVRQAAGKQARILNQIIDEFFQGKHEFPEERLKELLGHTPVEVIVGLLVGILVAFGGDFAWNYIATQVGHVII